MGYSSLLDEITLSQLLVHRQCLQNDHELRTMGTSIGTSLSDIKIQSVVEYSKIEGIGLLTFEGLNGNIHNMLRIEFSYFLQLIGCAGINVQKCLIHRSFHNFL